MCIFDTIMKHLPNLLTLGNLFCGCMAIVYMLTAQPFVYADINNHSLQWVIRTEQFYMGSIFIAIAALCDMLDGFTARALKVFSPIGKDLDSLADVVSFGVAPAVIMYKFLWDASMEQRDAVDAGIIGLLPAFLIACFAALRLAKFNVTASEQKSYFIGMPTPAVGIFIGSLPAIVWTNPLNIYTYVHNKWVLYFLIALCCWLMVSKVKFFKMIPSGKGLAYMWPQLLIIISSLALVPILKVAVIPFAFLLYVILSLVYKHPSTKENLA